MYKILIIEDDKMIREELKYVLEASNYEAVLIEDFTCIEEQVRSIQPHLILLDINLPGEDGFSLCVSIRKHETVPILFVTSRNNDMDELKSITIGGDDFITKPYNTPILLARIGRIINRVYKDSQNTTRFICQDVELDLETSNISYDGKHAALTRNEMYIALYLFRNKEKICKRTDIIDNLWDHEIFIDDNALSVNITRIRGKLEELGIKDFIHTKHSMGYYIGQL